MKYLKAIWNFIKLIWKMRFILPPAIAILALLWLTAFYWMEAWWMKEKIVTVPHIKYARTAQARELTVEEYVCTKKWDCKTALAVAKAESEQRCDAQNINTDRSIDVGYFQINSVHLRKGWKVGELLDCKTNIDRAFEIYQAQGWQPWSAYKNGSFKKHLN